MSKTYFDGKVTVFGADCRDVLRTLPDNSVDACCTDPPYHLLSIVKRFGGKNAAAAQFGTDGAFGRASRGFLGQTWDGGDIAFQPELWAEVLRVLKPGAFILAFGSSRTYHRLGCAIEDAGFITHPLVGWITGQGLPKATRVKAEGWEGWRYGTQALKPAIEPIYCGQKPFEKGLTGTQNILRWGTGAINIDGCRVATDESVSGGGSPGMRFNGQNDRPCWGDGYERKPTVGNTLGRWPANVITDGSDEVLAVFPEAHGAGFARAGKFGGEYDATSYDLSGEREMGRFGDEGSAARFFYQVKQDEPCHSERGEAAFASRLYYTAKADDDDRLGSGHPTVKPLDLVRYLVRLICRKGGTVIDLFAGTGTTGEASFREGCKAILIEREEAYLKDIDRRMALMMEGRTTRRHASVKARGKAEKPAPLFDRGS